MSITGQLGTCGTKDSLSCTYHTLKSTYYDQWKAQLSHISYTVLSASSTAIFYSVWKGKPHQHSEIHSCYHNLKMTAFYRVQLNASYMTYDWKIKAMDLKHRFHFHTLNNKHLISKHIWLNFIDLSFNEWDVRIHTPTQI